MHKQTSIADGLGKVKFYVPLVPLLILLLAITLASVLAYCILYGFGDLVPMNKLISKGTQVLLILSIYPLMKYLHLTKEDIGFSTINVFFRQLGLGLILGLMTLLPVMMMLFYSELKQIDPGFLFTAASLTKALSGTLLVGLLVALGEEPLFRGLLLTGLNKKMRAGSAILIGALYYAALHFLRTDTEIPVDEINFLSGFVLAGEAFENLFSEKVISAFLALTMVGVFLGVLRIHVKHSLGLCIGCHASWVWQIKMNKKILINNPDSEFNFMVSSYDGVIGPLVTGWLILVVAVYLLYQRYLPRSNSFI